MDSVEERLVNEYLNGKATADATITNSDKAF